MANESIRASEEFKSIRLMMPAAKAADDLTEIRGHGVGPLESRTGPYDRCSARLEQIQAMCILIVSGSEAGAFKNLNEKVQLAYIETIGDLASAASVDLMLVANEGRVAK